MNQQDILLTIIKLLNKKGVPYALTGSFATAYFGYPRATHDIDFVIEVLPQNQVMIANTLGKLNKPFLADTEDILSSLSKGLNFNLYHLATGTKIDFFLVKSKPYDQIKFKRRKKVAYHGETLFITSPEDLILTKLLWCKKVFSERHFGDCVGIWKIQKEQLDKQYLTSWAKKLGVEDFLEKVKKGKIE